MNNTLRWTFVVGLCTLIVACFPGMPQQGQQTVKTDPVVSPDGMKIAFVSTHDGDAEIFIMNADGSNVKRLTENNAVDAAPSWFPEGDKIIFVSDREGSFELYTMNPDGSSQLLLATIVE